MERVFRLESDATIDYHKREIRRIGASADRLRYLHSPMKAERGRLTLHNSLILSFSLRLTSIVLRIRHLALVRLQGS